MPDTHRLNRKIVIQVEAATHEECEEVADAMDQAMQRILDEGGTLADWPDARVKILHDEDVFDEEE